MKQLLMVVLSLGWVGGALASGPGVHIRECDRVLELLIENDPYFEGLAQVDMAQSYLRFGALSPDFEKAVDSITFGHETGLSHHLLEAAKEKEPQFELFALGHLCHQGSDGAMESLVVPAFFGSKPIGLYSLFGEYSDGRADSEGIIESIGDLLTGDWFALVNTLYDFWFDGPEAQERAIELFQWYCAEGAAYHGKNTDCEQVQVDLENLLSKGDAIIGLMDREQALEFVAMLLDQPIEDLVDLAAGGLFSAMLSGELEPGPEYDAELERFKESVFVEPEFWQLYEELKELGPAYTLDFMKEKSPTGSWPIYNGKAILCGNLQSIMNFAPEAYHVTPGLVVDKVEYRDLDGVTLESVAPSPEGTEVTATIRFFSAFAFSGKVRGVVREDREGYDPSGDSVVGEASIDVAIDPLGYVVVPRSVLEIPFVAVSSDALGYYIEIYAGEAEKPFFTTSWDRLWSIGQLDLGRDIYKDNFGTYGHWPQSLPLDGVASKFGAVMVRVKDGQTLAPVEGATVTLATGFEKTTAANGIAVFDLVEAGEVTVQVTGPEGYGVAALPAVGVLAMTENWVNAALQPLVDVVERTPYAGLPASTGNGVPRAEYTPVEMAPDVMGDSGGDAAAEDVPTEVGADWASQGEAVLPDAAVAEAPVAEAPEPEQSSGGCAQGRVAGGLHLLAALLLALLLGRWPRLRLLRRSNK